MTPELIVLSIVLALIAAELYGYAKPVALHVVKLVVLMLPSDQRARTLEEWSRHIEDKADQEHKLSALVWACGCPLGAVRMNLMFGVLNRGDVAVGSSLLAGGFTGLGLGVVGLVRIAQTGQLRLAIIGFVLAIFGLVLLAGGLFVLSGGGLMTALARGDAAFRVSALVLGASGLTAGTFMIARGIVQREETVIEGTFVAMSAIGMLFDKGGRDVLLVEAAGLWEVLLLLPFHAQSLRSHHLIPAAAISVGTMAIVITGLALLPTKQARTAVLAGLALLLLAMARMVRLVVTAGSGDVVLRCVFVVTVGAGTAGLGAGLVAAGLLPQWRTQVKNG